MNFEERAFCELYEAIKLYEKSFQKFSKEAQKHLKRAYKLLRQVRLRYISFYKEMNTEIKRLTEIIKGTAVLAQSDLFNLADLEKIAWSLAEPTLTNVKAINDQLWEKYHGKELQEFGFKYYLSRFYATTLGRITTSLILGYMLITIISFTYCFLFGIDFVLFCRQHPSIIIMGGAVLSGISFFGKKQT